MTGAKQAVQVQGNNAPLIGVCVNLPLYAPLQGKGNLPRFAPVCPLPFEPLKIDEI